MTGRNYRATGRASGSSWPWGELVAWSGQAATDDRIRLGLVLLPAALGLLFGQDNLVVLLALGVLLATLATVRVSVGAHGLRVRPGMVRWPAVHLPLDRIARAEAIDLRPTRWGGWGYRGSLRLMRRAAWVVRAGPGLRIDLTDGGVFAVTVDHPEDAAKVLNGLVSRHPDPAARVASPVFRWCECRGAVPPRRRDRGHRTQPGGPADGASEASD